MSENKKPRSKLRKVARNLQASDKSAMRIYDDTQRHYQGNYQCDKERILYTPSFRRLIGKTQIFNVGIGEHYRNRMTHTLEVVQIATTISKLLGLNLELTETIALGHDIGHTPFGHIGEKALNYFMNNCDILKTYGVELKEGQKGYKHNLQALRILCNTEKNSRDYNGIDLTTDTLWGIIHHTDMTWKKCEKLGEDNLTCLLRRDRQNIPCVNLNDVEALQDVDFYDQYIREIPDESWTFEAYIIKYADDIAQRHHDVEDGIISDIFEPTSFTKAFEEAFKGTECYKPRVKNELENITKETEKEFLLPRLSRFIIDFYIKNYIFAVSENLETKIIKEFSIKDNEDFYIKKAEIKKKADLDKIMSFNEGFHQPDEKIKDQLKKRIINSRKAQLMDGKGTFIIKKLFEAYLNTPNQLPDNIIKTLFTEYRNDTKRKEEISKYEIGGWRSELDDKSVIQNNDFLLCLCRNICDYISSMTDRYALKQYEKLYGSNVLF